MKRLLAKLPRSSRGSRELSASSSAAALPADIFDVSITGAAPLAVVSSAICFSGASSDAFSIAQRTPAINRKPGPEHHPVVGILRRGHDLFFQTPRRFIHHQVDQTV